MFLREKVAIPALQKVNLEIKEGEFVGLIGPNGAGKTTLTKIMTGLLYPDHGGVVKVLGYTSFEKHHNFLKEISLVSGQKNQLLWDLSAMDSFLLQKEIYRIDNIQFHKRIQELAELFQVTEQLNVPVRKLSFGQRMKLEIIAALLHSPKVLFLDEPTIGLDLIAQKSIRKFLKIYNQKYKATIILTSHNLDDIKQLCERVILINHGQIVYDGNLNKLGQESEILQYKLIEMTMGDQIDPERFNKYGNIVEANGFKVKLMVKAENISLIIPQLFNEFRIQDISVKENEIEDVIEKIMLKSM